jgi:hypothetical protein
MIPGEVSAGGGAVPGSLDTSGLDPLLWLAGPGGAVNNELA